MKLNYLLNRLVMVLIIGFAVFGCSKDSSQNDDNQNNNNPDNPDFAFYESVEMLNLAYDNFIENASSTNGDRWKSMVMTNAWLQSQEGVETTVMFDSLYIVIEMESGMSTMFYQIELDQDGHSIYRGGGTGTLTRFQSSATCSNVIENKNVLVYSAAHSQFYSNPAPLNQVVNIFNSSDQDFTVTVLTDGQCTPEIIETFPNYGFVTIETHGTPSSFLTGVDFNIPEDLPDSYIAFRDFLIQAVGQSTYNKLLLGKCTVGRRFESSFNINWWNDPGHSLNSGRHQVWVTTKYIKELPNLSGTVILGNMCYSGRTKVTQNVTDPIGKTFSDRSPISYYGYAYNNGNSAPVRDSFCKNMLDTIVRSLVNISDSTGIAHLKSDGSEFIDPGNMQLKLKHMNSPSWCYEGCIDLFTDDRDGQEYMAVCIGDQTWMAENLNWSGAGRCYDDNAANCNTYGRLYTITELTSLQSSTDTTVVKGLCPEGWHVPSKAEFQELIDFCGGPADAAEKLRSASGWPNAHSDEFGFNLLPSGHYVSDGTNSVYQYIGTDAKLWTSTEENGLYSAINAYHPNFSLSTYSVTLPEWAFSCRCIKD